MKTRHAVVFVALILVVGGFAIARQVVPDPPRYKFLPFVKNYGVYRGNLETGEVQLLVYREKDGKRQLVMLDEDQQPKEKPSLQGSSYDGEVADWTPSPLVDYAALGIDPKTGLVADWALYNRARKERGWDPVDPTTLR